MVRATLVAGSSLAGRFHIVRVLGSGGYGAVYEAQRIGASERVALKVLHTDVAADDTERKRFVREAHVMTALRHPHIAAVVETGQTDDGAPYLALELLQGCTLRDQIRRSGPLPVEWVGQVARQVLLALIEAHRCGTVHRDLKPHNLFLCSDQPTSPFVKVLDFGIAKLVGAGVQAHTKLTTAGAILGTARYMAPEQVYGNEVGLAADLYALGLIMAEMLAGRPIVQGGDDLEILMAQVSNTPHVLPPEVASSALGRIIQRAVHKSTAHRYSSANEMLAELDSTRSPAPLLPARRSVSVRPRSMAPWLLGAGAILAVVVGGLGAASWWLWSDGAAAPWRFGRGGVRWSGPLHSLSMRTVAKILEPHGWRATGSSEFTSEGQAEHRTDVRTVQVDRAGESCGVTLSRYQSVEVAKTLEPHINRSVLPGYRLASHREGATLLHASCPETDPRDLLQVVLDARE
ncbi:MAG: serine/threonine protein kinase [Deltaproteobacteria bacterium]|jgi:serine/threonine protein kinase|nr:serine/threonine protein kinase [Deltaproteobacteria bacterium]MBW2536849.1 serine/threonine protein kinase [Deltaproteobacteria bacterium]